MPDPRTPFPSLQQAIIIGSSPTFLVTFDYLWPVFVIRMIFSSVSLLGVSQPVSNCRRGIDQGKNARMKCHAKTQRHRGKSKVGPAERLFLLPETLRWSSHFSLFTFHFSPLTDHR
jgi:hypothetical protein